MERDCEHCIHRIPILDEENGIWSGANCEMWDCDFVDRREALAAYEGIKPEKKEGYWKLKTADDGNLYRSCSVCCKNNFLGEFPFCPYCGADMRKGSFK